MRTLPPILPTPEQLPIISNPRAGVMVIRGAAGSGKTSTAILRLKVLATTWLSRRMRLGLTAPIRLLVVTYNRTLRGYVHTLAEDQIAGRSHLELTVSTLAKLGRSVLPDLSLVKDEVRKAKLQGLCGPVVGYATFWLEELDYILGRFLPNQLEEYLDCSRDGRGTSPRIDRAVRKRLLEEVIQPYVDWKAKEGLKDWNDQAILLKTETHRPRFDVIIADECQDFSANEIRTILALGADPSSITFVLDSAQRIYPRGFTWKEVGVIKPTSHRLAANHRNTRQIAAFAAPIVAGLTLDDDGTLPDFSSCTRDGPIPVVLCGRYAGQLDYVLKNILSSVDLAHESVAFLKPQGGQWFKEIKQKLDANSFAWVELTKMEDWPNGTSNIGLSTMFSAKGLEFDHVIILGLNQQVTPHGIDPNDSNWENLRRLLAMAVTRARKTVTIGYKPEEASKLTHLLNPATFQQVSV